MDSALQLQVFLPIQAIWIPFSGSPPVDATQFAGFGVFVALWPGCHCKANEEASRSSLASTLIERRYMRCIDT